MSGNVVFLTGGARGIGLDAAQRLHARGHRLVLVDVDEELAKTEAKRLGEGALGIGADVRTRAELDRAVAETLSKFGRIDVAIANAGVGPPIETVRAGSEAAFDRVLDINLHGVVNTVRATLPAVIEQRGYMLLVASLYAVVNGALASPYAMSKAAVEMLGRSLRVELVSTGVDVGVAYFGFIDTKLVRDGFERAGIEELRRSLPRFITNPVPVGRAGKAIARGVEKRSVRVTAPGWVRATLPFRGLVQYVDGRMARDTSIRAAIEAAERAQRES